MNDQQLWGMQPPTVPAAPPVQAAPGSVPLPPQPVYYWVPAPVQDQRVKRGAKSFNRLSLVTIAQFVGAFLLEIPLVWMLTFSGQNITGDPMLMALLEGAMVPFTTALPFVLVAVFSQQKITGLVKLQRTDRVLALLLIVAGLGVVLVGNLPSGWLQEIMGNNGYQPLDQVGEMTTLPVFLVEFLVTAVLVPMMEEFAFRGVLLSRLEHHGQGFALVGSAMIFGLAHMDAATAIFAFLAGLVFGFLYMRTRNLWVSIAVHALNNGLAVLGSSGSLLMPEETMEIVGNVTFYGPILLGAVALILLVTVKRKALLAPFTRDEFTAAQPLTAGESLAAYARAPGFWLLLGVSVVFTLSLFFR